MSIEFKIGADPEFFVIDTNTGKHVSAHGMVPGTKYDPLKVEGGAVQVDGMALEFNIDPAKTFKEFNDNINKVLGALRQMVPAHYKFDFSPVAHFGKEYIDAQPDEAKALGCDPDFDAWNDGAINPKPDGNMGIRTASGHIHVGWTEDQDTTDPEHIQAGIMLTKQLDYYLGVPSLLWDQNQQRRSMYGNPGAFRPKRYGVEYRTLSNVWVDNVDLRRIVFEQSLKAAQMLIGGSRVYESQSDGYAKYLFQYGNWTEIKEMVEGYIPWVSVTTYNMYNTFAREFGDHPRPESILYTEAMLRGCFYNRKTNEMREWEDLSHEEYLNGNWTNTHAIYRVCKGENQPKPDSKRVEQPRPGSVYSKAVDYYGGGAPKKLLKGVKADEFKLQWAKAIDNLPPMPQNVKKIVGLGNQPQAPLLIDDFDGPAAADPFDINEF